MGCIDSANPISTKFIFHIPVGYSMEYCCFAPVGPVFSLSSSCFNGCFESLITSAISPLCSLSSCFGIEEGAYIVTGGNRGVGYHTARILLQQNRHVIILSRNSHNGQQAVEKLQTSTGNKKIEYQTVDLSKLDTVFAFIKLMEQRQLPVIGLINNAGIISHDSMKVNHLGHFALTIGLLPYLQLSVERNGFARLVHVASCAHFDGSFVVKSHIDRLIDSTSNHFSGGDWFAYSASKAANVLFSFNLSRYLKGRGISVTSYHPGVMLTDLWRDQQHNNSSINDTNSTADTSNIASTNIGEQSRSNVRKLAFCCVKHPMVSAIGLSALSTPRCMCSSHDNDSSSNSSKSNICLLFGNCMNLLHDICIGSSGGYYQQCLCCTVLPVRPSPILTNKKLQDLLWVNSMLAIERDNGELYTYLLSTLSSLNVNAPNRSNSCSNSVNVDNIDHDSSANSKNNNHICDLLVSPAWPCTECLSIAPYCVCFACLC